MNFSIKKSGKYERAYIEQSVRKNGKVVSVMVESLGRVDELLQEKGMTREEFVAWGKARAAELNAQKQDVQISLSVEKKITKDEKRLYSAGYLFIQKMYTDMRMKEVIRKIREKPNPQFMF